MMYTRKLTRIFDVFYIYHDYNSLTNSSALSHHFLVTKVSREGSVEGAGFTVKAGVWVRMPHISVV